MAELKTKQNDASVVDFLNSAEDEKRRKDAFEILDLLSRLSGEEAKMWGPSIIGFGSYNYKYASGREMDWMLTGFSPRKQSLTLYIMTGFEKYEQLLGKLGKYKTGKSCLYINKLEDIDKQVLSEIILKWVKQLRKE